MQGLASPDVRQIRGSGPLLLSSGQKELERLLPLSLRLIPQPRHNKIPLIPGLRGSSALNQVTSSGACMVRTSRSWRPVEDLNLRPSPSQGDALSTALTSQEPLVGIEPTSPSYESGALAIELQGRVWAVSSSFTPLSRHPDHRILSHYAHNRINLTWRMSRFPASFA